MYYVSKGLADLFSSKRSFGSCAAGGESFGAWGGILNQHTNWSAKNLNPPLQKKL